MIKIAFFDVDGTLLKMGGKEPSKKTISTLKQLQKRGYYYVWQQGEVILLFQILKELILMSY